MHYDLDHLLEAAQRIAREGGDHTLKYFNKQYRVDYKSDDSPVTVADRETEALMRESIMKQFPEHGILGEEHGRHNEGSRIQWILDPIDGTLSFIHGVPLYTTLIGVLVDDEPVLGVIYAPARDEMCAAANGKGAFLNGEPCRVRECENLSEATLLSTDVTSMREYGFEAPFGELLDKTYVHRTWGDAYGHMLVATGRADIMFDAVLNIWDAAPLLTVLQEAGGAFIDVYGKPTIQTGNGISCSASMLEPVKKIFNH